MPSPGDLFLDLEGDPFALDDGVDYLFGILEPGRLDADGEPLFHAFWSRDEDGRITPEAEQRAFERTIDLIIERLDADPTLHVYHYASYEPAHLGLLMGRYGTREEEVDRLMRGNVLVDLFSVVRQGVRVGVESYSIKKLEPLYGYVREVDLRDAGSSIVAFETWLEVGGESGQDDETLGRIERYNRDDVVSTWQLRDWLEGQRAELEHELGAALPRPGPRDGEASEQLSEWLAKVRDTAAQLTAGLPEDPDSWVAGAARPLAAGAAPGVAPAGGEARLVALLPPAGGPHGRGAARGAGAAVHAGAGRAWRTRSGARTATASRPRSTRSANAVAWTRSAARHFSVVELDDQRGEIVLRFAKTWKGVEHPTALVPELVVRTTEQQSSLLRIGQAVAADGLAEDGPYRAARDLLARRPPHVWGVAPGATCGPKVRSAEAAARDLVTRLDRTYLAIQGPPGSGKTWTGARMILDLVAQGRKVGVTANSHKVIGKMLDDVIDRGRLRTRASRIGHHASARSPDRIASSPARRPRSSAPTRMSRPPWSTMRWTWSVAQPGSGHTSGWQTAWTSSSSTRPASSRWPTLWPCQPLPGTSCCWAIRSSWTSPRRARTRRERDAAPSPICWTTTPPCPGISGSSWSAPGGCTRTSAPTPRRPSTRASWSHRRATRSRASAACRRWTARASDFLAVDHVADRDDTDSPAEAEVVAEIVGRLLSAGATWTDAKGGTRTVTPEDILIVSPFNLHRRRIRAALEARGEAAARVPVGTVDKFQGQQAPISIYSMATSRPEDAPRGLEFLYSLNRLNVATSRARCLTLVVASPALVLVDARTPRQMELANALCRFVEVAERVASSVLPIGLPGIVALRRHA